MQQQSAVVAVSDGQAWIEVATPVDRTGTMAEVTAVADFPAAERERDIARPGIVWYSRH
jgi:hypothetical protein